MPLLGGIDGDMVSSGASVVRHGRAVGWGKTRHSNSKVCHAPLEVDGLVDRKAHAPAKVVYSLTGRGAALIAGAVPLCQWGDQFAPRAENGGSASCA